MQYTSLGRSGLQVSRLCLGTMNFGSNTEEKEAFRIMDAALEYGINFFDTADVYGGVYNRGRTEEIIGRWFARGGGRREKVILASKVYGPMEYPGEGPGAKGGLSAFRIRRHLEGSLSRLQTDHIDLYQMHHVDPSVTWEELWEAFEIAQRQGKIGYVGSSNFAGWHIVEAQAAARSRNFLGLVSEQHRYNLVCRLPELEVLPAASHLGIGIIPYSPLGGGLLGGDVLNPPAGSRRATEGMRKAVEKHRPQVEKYSSFCRELGQKEADVALAWLLANPAVAAPIVGPRTLGQLQSMLRSLQIKLDEDALAKLDEIFPGPGGEAPEAYAPQGQLLRPAPVNPTL